MGSNCLLIALVAGYRRVPEPPARMIPTRSFSPAGDAFMALDCSPLGDSGRREAFGRDRYFFCAALSAFAVALMIASEVMVAPLVASTPFTPCFSTILRVVSEMDE